MTSFCKRFVGLQESHLHTMMDTGSTGSSMGKGGARLPLQNTSTRWGLNVQKHPKALERPVQFSLDQDLKSNGAHLAGQDGI